MKRIAVTVLLFLVIAVSTVLAAAVKPLSVKEARTLIDKTPTLYILDVRSADEYRQIRMKNSVLIPINELERRLNEVPKNRPVLVLCAVGARSRSAADFLAGHGYSEVYHLDNGIFAWARAGMPVEK